MKTTRRSFCKTAGYLACGFMGLQHFCRAENMPRDPGYGRLIPDPHRVFDLPAGFSYEIIATKGQPLSDGFFLPGQPDGMAAFPGENGEVILIMNHELGEKHSPHLGAFGTDYRLLTDEIKPQLYDAGRILPLLGGTTTLVYHPTEKRVVKHFLSLAGTERNCAGGPSPWNTWITCEETDDLRAGLLWSQDHGYAFEVPATSEMKLTPPVPLKAMGRFRREAVAVDPKTSIVYQTEDIDDGLIYRFIPNTPQQLSAGGRLQALAVQGSPGRDTRNWIDTNAPTLPQQTSFPVEWVDMADVESPLNDLRYQGRKNGAAVFARGEGMWFGDDEVYWACTNGGARQVGQIFRYRPSPFEGTPRESEQPGQLDLFLESKDDHVLAYADNLTVADWGDLFVAEDPGVEDHAARLVGITPAGKCYHLGQNSYNESELAGACFSPDHSILFVNIQKSGLTLAITGPWDNKLQG